RSRVLPDVLSLVQPLPPPLRNRPHDPRGRPLRARRGCPRRAPARSGGRLRCDARAVRPPLAAAASATDRRLDQQAHDRGGCSLNSTTECLNRLDRLRSDRKTPAIAWVLGAKDGDGDVGVHAIGDTCVKTSDTPRAGAQRSGSTLPLCRDAIRGHRGSGVPAPVPARLEAKGLNLCAAVDDDRREAATVQALQDLLPDGPLLTDATGPGELCAASELGRSELRPPSMFEAPGAVSPRRT